jgi:iron complex transport system substrate-binding protein
MALPAISSGRAPARGGTAIAMPQAMTRTFDEITGEIIEAAIRIHEGLGPGLLESVYQSVLARELERRGMFVQANRSVPFQFNGMTFNNGLCIDLLIEQRVIVELKSVEKLNPVHFKQLLTYLRLLDLRVGLLINFGCATLKEGLHRVVNGYSDPPTSAAPPSTNPASSASPA